MKLKQRGTLLPSPLLGMTTPTTTCIKAITGTSTQQQTVQTDDLYLHNTAVVEHSASSSVFSRGIEPELVHSACLLYTSDAADE